MKIFSLLLLATSLSLTAHAAKQKVQRKPNSLKQILITCKPQISSEAVSGGVVVYEDQVDANRSKWIIELVVQKVQTFEVEALNLIPRAGFSESDAASGSTRFLKSLVLVSRTNQFELSSDFNTEFDGYPTTFQNRNYFCKLNGSFNEALNAIKKTFIK